MNNPLLAATPLAQSQQTTAVPSPTEPASTHRPGSFFARVQMIFSKSAVGGARRLYSELTNEADEFMEYHNPTLSIRGYEKKNE